MEMGSGRERLAAGTFIDAFVAFVRADTWQATRRYLETHPGLVGDEAYQAIRPWVASIDDDGDRWWYEYHLALLQGCKLMGIAPMFDSLDPATGPPQGVVAPEAFEDDLRRLADLDVAASRQPTVHRDRIALMEGIVRRLPPTDASLFRTAMLINIAQANAQLPTGDRAVNLQNASAYLIEAAQFITPKTAPPAYAASQRSLGLEYTELSTGRPTANFDKAIGCFEEALRFYSREYAPQMWALTKSDLGLAHARRPSSDREADLRQAIACFRDALGVFTLDAAPSEHDLLQKNLALATTQLDRLRGESR
jgi:tetratricopeptide (TPR) repeat protein